MQNFSIPTRTFCTDKILNLIDMGIVSFKGENSERMISRYPVIIPNPNVVSLSYPLATSFKNEPDGILNTSPSIIGIVAKASF